MRRHLVFVGGKGGVGKTTTAAALAVAASEAQRTCLLVSTDPAHSLGDIFGRPIGATERLLLPNLTGLEIDPDAEAARHIATVKDHMKAMVHPRLYDQVERQLDLARHAPGAAEAALLERVAELMGEAGSRFDLVIFDTAPSGHTIRLLSLPEIMRAWTDGLLRHRERSRRLSSALKHLVGGRVKRDDRSRVDGAEDDEPSSGHARIDEVLRTRRRKFLVARERLLDTAMTAFFLVVNPDRLSILESQKVHDVLVRFNVPISAVVVNRVLSDDASGDFVNRRREQEIVYRQEIDRRFQKLPRFVVPLLPHDVHGVEAIRQVSRRLGGVLDSG